MTSRSSLRCGFSASASAGSTARPSARRPRRISALASTIASSVPSNSRCTGPTFVIAATSGSAISQSSAIWPIPRIAISMTRISVSGGAASSASGIPISVLKFSGLAWTRPGRIARQMSFTEVFPVEPVIPTSGQPIARRQPRASDCNASNGSAAAKTRPAGGSPAISPAARSGVTMTPHAPAVSAPEANSPPSTRAPGRPTNRSPPPTSRESITTRAGRVPPAPAPGVRRLAPASAAICSAASSIIGPRAPRGPRPGRRTGSSVRPRTPDPVHGPCRRSRPDHPTGPDRLPGRWRGAGRARR